MLERKDKNVVLPLLTKSFTIVPDFGSHPWLRGISLAHHPLK
jgi:hypothetical protein